MRDVDVRTFQNCADAANFRLQLKGWIIGPAFMAIVATLLAKFEGMSYQDIAETMGLSVQAIKSLLSRARVNLKEILTPYVEQGTPPEEGEPKKPGNGQVEDE